MMQIIPMVSVLIAGVMPIVGAAFAKWGFESYDNNNPRAWLANQTGFRARANAAQANSFEAFPFFAAGVLFAVWAKVDADCLNAICIAFVLLRCSFLWAYITDRAQFRSLVWSLAYLCSISLFIAAIFASA
jgi:hypothetical protein